MATWKDLAEDNHSACYEMYRHGRWRSCINRAYFAVYSAATEELVRKRVPMAQGREGPSHADLPELVRNNLTKVSFPLRRQLAGKIRRLYGFRRFADYLPSVLMEKNEARKCMGLMVEVLDVL